MEKVKFTDGCPNQCAYCYEPIEIKTYDPGLIPKECQILDMNFLANPSAVCFLTNFKRGKYEMVCGFDYRRLTEGICKLIHDKGFIKVRWAWDYGFSQQKKHRAILKMFLKAGYQPKSLSVFIIVNWKIPYAECTRKLDLLKVWNVKVNDCCYDGGYPKSEIDYNSNKRFNEKRFWAYPDIKRFRAMCRKHNQLVNFGIDPEWRC